MKINVLKPVLVSNQERAKENRKFFDRYNSLVLNIIGAPGSGKTSVIENIVKKLKSSYRILVIEGDIKGSLDSEKLMKTGIDTIQINTITECHLDAFMISQALPKINKPYDLIMVENVGNLVCPAEFDIGEDFKVAILSTPEGDDKPVKYPLLFHRARVVIINKTDLLPYVDFKIKNARKNILAKNPRTMIFEVSARNGKGFDKLINFLKKELAKKK
ncbi:MAG: hydrogenase nickel incorporation protein HypB [candidate division WOR-3 bacterium]|nr:hydrogenase nickel incorporation protein HypB [candidate division WOR-3 bacterium]